MNGTVGLPLSPLVFWNHCQHHPELDCGHCYFYDRVESSGAFSFKAAGAPCTCIASVDNDLAPVAELLGDFVNADPTIALADIGELSSLDEREAVFVL